jgi:hypothetical protein
MPLRAAEDATCGPNCPFCSKTYFCRDTKDQSFGTASVKSHTHAFTAEIAFADVDYRGTIFLDAKQRNGIWFFEDWVGESYLFAKQDDVKPINSPRRVPRHSESFSGYTYGRLTSPETT